jgi:hypothetical protein
VRDPSTSFRHRLTTPWALRLQDDFENPAYLSALLASCLIPFDGTYGFLSGTP